MARVKIRKIDGRWQSTVPGIGFLSTPRVQHHASHGDAIRAHVGRGAISSGMCTTDLGYQLVDRVAVTQQRPIYW
jgi:hypothetical protein